MEPDEINTFYLVAPPYKYHVLVKTMTVRGGPYTVGFRLGATNKGCVSMTLNYYNDNTLHISSIDYYATCSVSGRLARGEGTRHMINTSLTYMLDRYGPDIRHITVEDASKVPCKMDGGRVENVMLMYSYIAVTGKTWYENRFGAFVQNGAMRELYRKGIARLNDDAFKESVSLPPTAPAEVHAMYEGARTVAAFFSALQKAYGARFCFMTYGWIDVFIDDKVLINAVSSATKWEIAAASVDRIEYAIEPADGPPPSSIVQSAGGRKAMIDAYHASGGTISHRYGRQVE